MMAGSQEWLSKTMVGSRAQPTGRMVPSSQDCPGSIYRQFSNINQVTYASRTIRHAWSMIIQPFYCNIRSRYLRFEDVYEVCSAHDISYLIILLQTED